MAGSVIVLNTITLMLRARGVYWIVKMPYKKEFQQSVYNLTTSNGIRFFNIINLYLCTIMLVVNKL